MESVCVYAHARVSSVLTALMICSVMASATIVRYDRYDDHHDDDLDAHHTTHTTTTHHDDHHGHDAAHHRLHGLDVVRMQEAPMSLL